MANDCCGTARVVSKSREAIDRLDRIMNYKDDEFYLHRVRQFERVGEIEKNGDFYVCEFCTDACWSSEPWFDAGDHPEKLIVDHYEKGQDGLDDWNKPVLGTAHYSSFPTVCKKLGVGIELWAEEPGCCFEEHAVCDSNGNWDYSTEEHYESYPEDEDGEPDYGKEPEIVHGFGDEFGEWSCDSEIYDMGN